MRGAENAPRCGTSRDTDQRDNPKREVLEGQTDGCIEEAVYLGDRDLVSTLLYAVFFW